MYRCSVHSQSHTIEQWTVYKVIQCKLARVYCVNAGLKSELEEPAER